MYIQLLFWILLLALILPSGIGAQQVDVLEHELGNGLQILMVQRPGDPSISAGWVAHAGSVHERPGITGMAHLFEHMMFKGTRTIGTMDYNRDRTIIARKDSIRALMREEEAKLREMRRRGLVDDIPDPDIWSPRYFELSESFQALVREQREIIIKDELDRIYSNAGGTGLNAFTNTDMTFYMVTVPSNKIELFFWIESDRLLNPVFREFYSERDVVREERRLRIESTPTGKYDETFESLFYTAHPYGWPVIGWPSDVENITREQANEFYDIYYGADNLTFIFVGDLDPEEIIRLSEAYLSRLPSSPYPVPEVITEEIEQVAEKRMIAFAETNPTVRVRYHTAPFNHPDSFALEVLSGILSGRTGRLHRDLVLERELATQASAFQASRRFGGYFEFSVVTKENVRPEEVEKEIYAHIDRLRSEPVTDIELQRVKNQSIANAYRRLSSNFFLMLQLGFYEVLDSWRYINTQPSRIQDISVEDIAAVVERYFADEKRNVALYYTKTTGQTADPELAALPPGLQEQARQVTSQIRQISDKGQLNMMLAQTKAAGERITEADQQKMIQFVIRQLERRIEELEN